MAVDKVTGLPEVEEGLYWRVESYTNEAYAVHLMRKSKSKLGWQWLDDSLGWYTTYKNDGATGIARAARRVLERLPSSDSKDSLVGNYPPNSLNGKK